MSGPIYERTGLKQLSLPSMKSTQISPIPEPASFASRLRRMETSASDCCLHRSFCGRNGDAEHFLIFTAPDDMPFREQIDFIGTQYAGHLARLGLAQEPAVFCRVFLSDALTQAQHVRYADLVRASSSRPVAVSVVQQRPLPAGKAALLGYHVESQAPKAREQLSPRHLLVRKNGLGHLWSTRICSQDADGACSSATQTRRVFDELTKTLSGLGGTLRSNCQRTWIYVKAIDLFYEGMVKERRALFQEFGLSKDTNFIASTGIEGACEHRRDIVLMDAYSILGLEPRQISYLNDFSMLCPTINYNVTFERGTRVAYADRAHLFISGTASIDEKGNILHQGDVMSQLERTLANIEALLRSAKATLDDMMYLIVYLRDPTDYARVRARLFERLPGLPAIIVEGAVCQPGWLIEIEGVGIVGNDQPMLPSF